MILNPHVDSDKPLTPRFHPYFSYQVYAYFLDEYKPYHSQVFMNNIRIARWFT